MTERTVSVTELARFCHRSGDIDSRFGPSPTGAEGIAGHQRLYRQRPQSYQREYAVEYRHEAEGLTVLLRGRADGYDAQTGLVEEIKTCRVAAQSIPDAVSRLHLAQGKLYAAILCRQQQLDGLDVQLTWLNIDSDETWPLREYCSADQLEQFLDESLGRFSAWLAQVEQLRERRNASIETLPFPHGEFREGQRQMSELAYKCIDQSGHLLIEAPTGIGKTAAVLYPALKALARDKHDKLIFATAKTVGRRAAEDTLQQCRNSGLHAAALTLTAKERICFSPGKACHGDDCPYAKNYYDKLPAAMGAALAAQTLRREDIEQLATDFEACPYELAADLLPWIDIAVADYHYIYSLYGSLGGAMETDSQRWSILLDEAQNLPDRARGMYSAALAKSRLMRAKNEAPAAVAKALERVNKRMLAMAREPWQEQDYNCSEEVPENLLRALTDFAAAVSEALGQEPAFLSRCPTLRDFYFDALHFLRVGEEWGPEFRCQLTRDTGKQSLVVALNCLDPARLLTPRQARAHSVTAFSATLSPLDWARGSLGLAQDTVCHRAPSPFDAEQLKVQINTAVDTRYRQRGATLPDLASQLRNWLAETSGNCMLYFPSYRYMEDCLDQMGSSSIERRLWVQRPAQADSERSELLQLLAERSDVAAFCILGGVLGEGIDLPGDLLASVVVVGVGMPQVNRETRELEAWYQHSSGAGFEFTFLYPGMQKVAQALGRVVRGADDRGTALLIDPRYGQQSYRALLPPWWQYRALS